MVTAVGNPAEKPPGLASLTAALIGWPNLIAANLCFFPGGIMQVGRGSWLAGCARVCWGRGGPGCAALPCFVLHLSLLRLPMRALPTRALPCTCS